MQSGLQGAVHSHEQELRAVLAHWPEDDVCQPQSSGTQRKVQLLAGRGLALVGTGAVWVGKELQLHVGWCVEVDGGADFYFPSAALAVV